MQQKIKDYSSNYIKLHIDQQPSSIKNIHTQSLACSLANNKKNLKQKNIVQNRHTRIKTTDIPITYLISSGHNSQNDVCSLGIQKDKKYLNKHDKTRNNSTKIISIQNAKTKRIKTNSLADDERVQMNKSYRKSQAPVALKHTKKQKSTSSLKKTLKCKNLTSSFENIKNQWNNADQQKMHKFQKSMASLNPEYSLQCQRKANVPIKAQSSKLIKDAQKKNPYEKITQKLLDVIQSNKRQYNEKLRQKSQRYTKRENKFVDKINEMQKKNTRLIQLINYMRKKGINTDDYWQEMQRNP